MNESRIAFAEPLSIVTGKNIRNNTMNSKVGITADRGSEVGVILKIKDRSAPKALRRYFSLCHGAEDK